MSSLAQFRRVVAAPFATTPEQGFLVSIFESCTVTIVALFKKL